MSGLDERGDIAIALVVIYPFIAILTLILTIRHGFSRQAGWLFLLIFSICRIVGGILHIVAEKTNPPQIGLYIGAYTLEGIGLAPFLLCTKSFIEVVGRDVFGTPSLPLITRPRLRILGLLLTAGSVLIITGATQSSDDDESSVNTANELRKIGGILLAVTFVLLVILHLFLWQVQHMLQDFQRMLLKGISFALPFLAVRVLYSVLSNFAPTVNFGDTTSSSTSSSALSKFSSISGLWELYLFMSVLMEFCAISIYIYFGLKLPISKPAKPALDSGEYEYSKASGGNDSETRLYQHGTYPPQPAHGLGSNSAY